VSETTSSGEIVPFTEQEERWLVKEEGLVGKVYWPGGASGPTGDVGYDFGYQSIETVSRDWNDLPAQTLGQLLALTGLRGVRAEAAVRALTKPVLIPRDIAVKVFREKTAPRYWADCKRVYPGVEKLYRAGQLAMFSLTYNRGYKLTDDDPLRPETWRHEEQRAIRDYCAEGNQMMMADMFVVMARLWEGGRKDDDGLVGRREREAQLLDVTVTQRLEMLRKVRRDLM
jgi:hypothetical protein